jgi:two-component system, NarL family, nitrate/nitrite response regulator NarL
MNDVPVRLIIVAEHALFCAALAAAVAQDDAIQVVGEFDDPAQARLAYRRLVPHLVVVEAGHSASSGTAFCADLVSDYPEARVLVVSTSDDVDLLVSALEAGATGFVGSSGDLVELLAAVHSAVSGEAVIPGHLLGGVLRRLIQRRRDDSEALVRYRSLSQREQEVLRLLGRGLDQAGIAATLLISPQTARTHIQNVLTKLDLHSRVEAAGFAVEHGFTEAMAET